MQKRYDIRDRVTGWLFFTAHTYSADEAVAMWQNATGVDVTDQITLGAWYASEILVVDYASMRAQPVAYACI